MTSINKGVVLCVDDEPEILTGLKLNLRKNYTVLTAESGAAALALLAEHPEISVVISDMRMPGMDGASLLARTRKQFPAVVRILLTGFADMNAAIRAVNQGHLFRFLTKPCPADDLRIVVQAAVAQHRLQQSEKDLLEQTLYGSIETLSDTLAIALPEIYGGIAAVANIANALGVRAGLQPIWPLRIAAMLSKLGYVGLPRELVLRSLSGEVLSAHEAEQLDQAPDTVGRLLSHIPRLEPVQAIIALAHHDDASLPTTGPSLDLTLVEKSAAILRIAMEYCRLLDLDHEPDSALQLMRKEPLRFDRTVLDLLVDYLGSQQDTDIVELKLAQLRLGMILAEDCQSHSGVLIAAKGHVISHVFLERFQNFAKGGIVEPIRVYLPESGVAEQAAVSPLIPLADTK